MTVFITFHLQSRFQFQGWSWQSVVNPSSNAFIWCCSCCCCCCCCCCTNSNTVKSFLIMARVCPAIWTMIPDFLGRNAVLVPYPAPDVPSALVLLLVVVLIPLEVLPILLVNFGWSIIRKSRNGHDNCWDNSNFVTVTCFTSTIVFVLSVGDSLWSWIEIAGIDRLLLSLKLLLLAVVGITEDDVDCCLFDKKRG